MKKPAENTPGQFTQKMQSLIQKKNPDDKEKIQKSAVKPEKKQSNDTKKEAIEDKDVKNKHKT